MERKDAMYGRVSLRSLWKGERMKLLTKEIISKLPKLGVMDNKPANQVPIVAKFFHPLSSWTWYVTEGEQNEDGDWTFFGLVRGIETELGYFSLAELESFKDRFSLGIERDLYFGQHTLAEAQERQI